MSVFTQFAPNSIKSIQRGTISITGGNGSNTATITSVDTTKSLISFLGATAYSGAAADGQGRVELTDATTVTASRTNTNNSAVFGYQVVEYY